MRYFWSFLLLIAFSACQTQGHRQELQLRFHNPATVWEETLPLGNGRIGMMPDGGIETEHIILNDITMWSGSEDPDAINPEALSYLPEIRKLLLAGKNIEAQNLMYGHFRCGGLGSAFGNGKDAPYGCFQMLGEVQIRSSYPQPGEVSNYRRVLSLNDAVASTEFTKGGVNYEREYFASHTGDVLAIAYRADKEKSVSFEISLNRPEHAGVSVEGDAIVMKGRLSDGFGGDKGVRYLTRLQVINKGGSLNAGDSTLTVTGADEVVVLISSSTDMLDENYAETVDKLLKKAAGASFSHLKREHIAAYKSKFDRVTLYLGDQSNQLSTNERLNNFQTDDDPAFAALYFHYGRYLMISGTRENLLPLNLQGMWANQVQTPWNGDYHLNINVQMNYWPAEVCNLPELHKPLIDYTRSLVQSGEATAKGFYGADGWVAHMMSNPWNFTAPGEHASWGATNTGGAWLCRHLWEHYAFSQDEDYLRSVYPVMKGAAEFFLTSMIHEPTHDWLVTAPSSSPENAFYLPGSSDPAFVCMGPTMDVQIIRELFVNVLLSTVVLGMEQDSVISGIKDALPKLPPMQISPEGYLQEWLEDYREVEPQHRHVSHLYGLYPSNQISPLTTPDLAEAAKATLNRRGDGGTGWSRAWKINFWARLHDGNRAYKLLKSLLQPAVDNSMNLTGGGTYPNLFCAHPPFQIDGNFGGTAGIAEMLIQSHDGYVEVLPALPDAWPSGSFSGLRIRGGAEISAIWKDKQLKRIGIISTNGNAFKLKLPPDVVSASQKGKSISIDNGFASIRLDKGKGMIVELEY